MDLASGILSLGMSLALVSPIACKVDLLNCPGTNSLPVVHEWYQPGDIIIGQVTSQFNVQLHSFNFDRPPSQQIPDPPEMMTKFYQHILALVFSTQEINTNPDILPNATLGFHIYDSYHSPELMYRSTMDLLFKLRKSVPNYRCDRKKNLIAVIGGADAESSFRMADILGPYKLPQLTYGSFAFEGRDAREFPTFYRISPNEAHQYQAIISLLLHFQWTWVGLLIVDDDSGEKFLKTLEPLLLSNGICLASTRRIQKQSKWDNIQDLLGLFLNLYPTLTDSKANTVLFYGEAVTMLIVNSLIFAGNWVSDKIASMERVWIFTGQVDIALSGLQRGFNYDWFQGALSFTIHSREVCGFQTYLHNVRPNWTEGNGFLKDFWGQTFNCSFPNSQEPVMDMGLCTGEERLEILPGPLFEMDMSGHSYSIYNAVYTVVHALHATFLSRSNHRAIMGGKRLELQDLQPWQLHHSLQATSFNNSAGEPMYFRNNEMRAGFDITHLIIFPNKSFQRVKVGKVSPDGTEGEQFVIHDNLIDWKTSSYQVLPLSVCNDYCYPGYHKQKKEREKFCCYHCAPCPEGKISDRKDMVDCFRCPEDKFPNKNQDRCIKKITVFLCFQEPLGFISTALAISLSLIAALILGSFIKHRNTPIVKANNRDITYMLLISLLLSSLCPLLFLGEPSKVTCLFQQAAFSIIFTTAVSAVLAKTLIVVVAFRATKPGSTMRKWVGKKLANFIVVSCSFVQVVICLIWLRTSPPFPDLDRQSFAREIVAECNEGSVMMFYIALGYLGLLSVISLIAAFLARNLPETFNEAKFITFSMLIVCSVWFCFVPTYLSTKGKYMVAVEIFSILASSVGLLGCIFLPKYYIILLKPELNEKHLLIYRRN